jgi:serine phosphatase RsbU (regulator of sigma subunit)
MVLAARPTAEILATLAELLEHERHHEKIFATLCMVSVAPERTHARLYLAGHPQPLLITEDGLAELRAPTCPPLGILPVLDWTGGEVQLGPDWTLLLYTDGLVEGRIGEGPDRLNSEGLIDLIETFRRGGEQVRGRRGDRPIAADEAAGAWSPDQLLDWLIDEVHTRNGGPVDDDLAVLAMRCASQAGGSE